MYYGQQGNSFGGYPVPQGFQNNFAQLEQTQNQINNKLDMLKQSANPQQQQPNTMYFTCFHITNIEELKSTPLTNPNTPMVGTNFLSGNMFVKNIDGTIDIYKKVVTESPPPTSVLATPQAEANEQKYVTIDSYNQLVNEFNEIKRILGGIEHVTTINATNDDGNVTEKSGVSRSGSTSSKATKSDTGTAKK